MTLFLRSSFASATEASTAGGSRWTFAQTVSQRLTEMGGKSASFPQSARLSGRGLLLSARVIALSRKRASRNAILSPFAARPIPMLESPAYRVLSRGARQVLARIEIEHAHHGGAENGALPVTYDHFVEYGVHRHSIAPAIRELVALGFIEVTRRGCAGNADCRQPSLYRLTYMQAKGERDNGTHEWRRVHSIEQAEALAKRARSDADTRAVAKGRKQKTSAGFRPVSMMELSTERQESLVTENVTTT